MAKKPNVIYVFADQHRADAVGYRGNPDVLSPNMDRLAACSIDFTMATAGYPVCCPSRASLLTGQYAGTHGVFMNDVSLGNEAVSIAEAFKQGGYDTAYVGKWHLHGRGRSEPIPPERRKGFDYWRVLECTHTYNESYYYADDGLEKLKWEGYDAEAQTECVMDYIRNRDSDNPFLMVLSWGPPHSPYLTAPQHYQDLYDGSKLTLRPNVPAELEEEARRNIAGYYAHVTALDHYLGTLRDLLTELDMDKDTLFIYTSDHGDMLCSQGLRAKQKPWDESIRVPFLLHYPALFGKQARRMDIPFSTPDIMPTLLGLCGLEIPVTVEGRDFSPILRGEAETVPDSDAVVLECYQPFGEWHRATGGREYRGIRTNRYTYVRDLNGPWLMYDNDEDPYQLNNLVDQASHSNIQENLDARLWELLRKRNDAFLPGEVYLKRHGYEVDETGTVPFVW